MTLLKFAISGILGTLTVSGFIKREMDNADTETTKPIDMVTIIVPSFNEEPFIKKCLSSIRGQSIIQEYPHDFELILVDSGSTDDTVKMAESYVDRIITTEKRGKLTTRNSAINIMIDFLLKYNLIGGLRRFVNSLNREGLLVPTWINI